MKSLKTVCSKFCGWEGELRDVREHIERKACERTYTPCPNACGIKIMRKNLKFHLGFLCRRRKQACDRCGQVNEYQLLGYHQLMKCPKRQYLCPYCNEAGCYDERTTTHLKVCQKVKIQCPKCSLKIFWNNLTSHSLTCTHEPVRCKYYNIGCMERPLRKDAERHEEDAQLHLAIATDKVLRLTNILLKNVIIFKLTSFKNRKSSKETFYSPHFFTSRSGYKLCLGVIASGFGSGEGTHITVAAYLMKGDNDDSLTWPFTGTVTVELLNQLEDKNHHKVTIKFPADIEASKRVVNGERATNGYGVPKFISHTRFYFKSEIKCRYLKDDMLVFQTSAEAPDYKPWLECTS